MFQNDDMVTVTLIDPSEPEIWSQPAIVEIHNDDCGLCLYFPDDDSVLHHHAYDAPNGGPATGVIQGASLTLVPSEKVPDLWTIVEPEETRFSEESQFRVELRERDGKVPEILLQRLQILQTLIGRF